MASGTDTSDQTGQPSDRRKLIVVVHADVVGYSRLIGLDDVGTLQALIPYCLNPALWMLTRD
jgi:hypothetical protein